MRANEPPYEVVSSVHLTARGQDLDATLSALAANFGSDARVEMQVAVVERKRQWDKFGNIWKNSAIRTLLRRDRRTPRAAAD